ncbi:MAG: glutamine synthetase [Thermonema sp.]|uniref:glutamine synthetase III family protein n=1 Tax=Thermonema sp. TaxID=2231181 RepID=UPI0021DB83CF|nr:glutamine synthetase III [Thermonema sp.]GIV40085.1 MAG: glutamine synthetase [Thermonema sp.]
MPTLRFRALLDAQNRPAVQVQEPEENVTRYFATQVFNKEAMRRYLSHETYKKLMYAIEHGETIDLELADAVAAGMKSWAISKGATHFTHWFQPLTGLTAEKHDAFFDIDSEGRAIEKFKGSELAQQEPDASSLPSGGIRSTFEARGYTAWDPSSPAFIMEINGSKTLCIPTIFISYTGESLDYKTPLLKSLHALDKAATAVCQYFDRDVSRVVATLGPEQEYFVIDKALYYARPDLVACGRTLFGHTPARGQQLEDHYFGSIPARVRAFMIDFETEALKLGIPIRTRHNEVAPAQFECAATFEEASVAVDHNLLLMDIMEKVADRHDLKVLFHEKPFAGVNGSGKHNNWSMMTNTGVNLLAPSTKAKENLRFLAFFVNVIKAVHDHADLLRASIMSAGNEYRLGANEAPPAIISVFIGEELTKVIEELEEKATVKINKGDNLYMKVGISKIPPVLRDNTDRNRTSPFAYTGNKFEFRAVGSSANCASNMIVLNTAVAAQLQQFKKDVDALIKKGEKKEVAIVRVLRDYIKASKRILFEGNNYSEEWAKEAEKRGLTNIKSCVRSLEAFVKPESVALFESQGVFTKREVEARYEIMLEAYVKRIQIESRMMGELALNHIIPAAINYQNRLLEAFERMQRAGIEEENLESIKITIRKIAEHVNMLQKKVKEMIDTRKEANKIEDIRRRAEFYTDEVKPLFDEIRYRGDKLELMVDDELWPLAKYRELLFVR